MAALEKETNNFEITVENPEENPDGTVKAETKTRPLWSEMDPYGERIKIKGRTCSEYANNIQDIFDLEDTEKNELKKELLKLKNDVKQKAQEQEKEEELEDETQRSVEQDFHEILHHIMSAGGTLEKEALEPDYEVMPVIDEMDGKAEYVFPSDSGLQITDKGRQKVREHLGMKAFEGDPEAEAQTQLEDNPLQYYLDSFNKIHKGDHLLKIWELISALSSTCADRQIHSWAVGPSGKGKSHLKRKLLNFLPPEAYEQKESFSPKALQYKTTEEGPGFMNNKLIYFDEVGENIENAIELIRLLTDQDKDVITHETIKDQEIITLDLETSNITVWFTSVDTIQDEQLKNRFILTNPDASSAQDETVNQHQQDILNLGGDLDFVPKEAPVVQRMVRDIRRETPDYKPIIPFKIEWKQKFNRRLYPFFYTLAGMIAKIHHKNRVTRNGYIFVTKADFELARLIWAKLIDTTVAQTDEQSIALLKQLPESEHDALKRREIRNRLSGFTTNKVKETCEKLEETEELQLINSKYEEGEWHHWAGEDVKKLVDNEPEIREFNQEIVTDMIEEAGIEPDDEILGSVFNSEIPVINYLKEQIDEDKDEEPEVQIQDEEEELLSEMKSYNWDATLKTLQTMNDDKDVIDLASTLEEKDVIRINGDDIPKPTATLDNLKDEGEVML